MTAEEFNWHELPESDLRKWVTTVILTYVREPSSPASFETLSAATSQWRNVRLELAVNGRIIPGSSDLWRRLDEAVEHSIEQGIEERAREIVNRAIDRVTDIFTHHLNADDILAAVRGEQVLDVEPFEAGYEAGYDACLHEAQGLPAPSAELAAETEGERRQELAELDMLDIMEGR